MTLGVTIPIQFFLIYQILKTPEMKTAVNAVFLHAAYALRSLKAV
jgi:hypothetical protein